MKIKTLNDLAEAVRNAHCIEDLNQLKRILGPSLEEEEKQAQRLKNLDRIADRCEFGSMCPSWEAKLARENYDRILRECGEFESIYC